MCAHAVILQLFVKNIFPPKFDNKQTNSLLHAFFFRDISILRQSFSHISPSVVA